MFVGAKARDIVWNTVGYNQHQDLGVQHVTYSNAFERSKRVEEVV